MKIAYVITRSDSVGGANVHLIDLAKGMQKCGHSVHVYVGGEGPFCASLAEAKVPYSRVSSLVRNISPFKDLLAYRTLKRLLIEFEPDLVHAHSSKAGILARLVCRQIKIPCIFTAHGWAFTEGVPKLQRLLYRNIERLIAPFATRIIAVSEYDRQLAIKQRVGVPHQIITILNGVADLAPRYENRNRHLGPVRLIMVARFDFQKDQFTLLESLSKISHLNWTLELVGDGVNKALAIEKAENLGLTDKVIFSGIRDDVHKRLMESDIFVLASRWEGLPLSILEAMSVGLPVIASSVGGVPETIEDGKTGFLVPPAGTEELAQKISALIEDPARRKRFGIRARKLYEEKFSLARMIQETLCVYEQVIHQSRSR